MTIRAAVMPQEWSGRIGPIGQPRTVRVVRWTVEAVVGEPPDLALSPAPSAAAAHREQPARIVTFYLGAH
jgi:hypothetical protein